MDYDRSTKRELYERLGVNEYWVIDPCEQQIDQWVLRDDKYELMPKSKVLALRMDNGIEVDARQKQQARSVVPSASKDLLVISSKRHKECAY